MTGSAAYTEILTPPASLLSLRDGRFVVGGEGHVDVISPKGKRLQSFTDHRGWVYALALQPDEKRVLAGDDSGRLKLWHLAQGASQSIAGTEAGLWAAAFSPDGQRAAVAGDAGVVWLIDPAAGRVTRALDARRARLRSVRGAELLALGDGAGRISVWETTPWGRRNAWPVHAGEVMAIAALPGGRWASGGANKRMVVTAANGARTEVGEHRNQIWSMASLPDGRVLAVDESGEARLHDPSDVTASKLVGSWNKDLYAVAIRPPDDKEAVIGGRSNDLFRLSLPEAKPLQNWTSGGNSAFSMTWTRDGKTLIEGTTVGEVFLHDGTTGKVTGTKTGLPGAVSGLLHLPPYLWAADSRGHLRRYSLDDDAAPDPLAIFDEPTPILGLTTFQNDRYLVEALGDGRALIRTLPNGKLVAWLLQLRDLDSWVAVDLEKGRFRYQGKAAAELRLVLPDGTTKTLAELAGQGNGVAMSLGVARLQPYPTGQIGVELNMVVPHGGAKLTMDDGARIEAIVPANVPSVSTAYVLLDPARGTRHRFMLRDADGETVTISVNLSSSPGASVPSRRRALLIGQVEYKEQPRLACAGEDVRRLRELIQDRSGWKLADADIEVASNLTAGALASRVEKFLGSGRPGEDLLLYFAGHGADEVLLGTDGTAADPRGIGADTLWKQVAASRASRVVALIDACASASIAQAFRRHASEAIESAHHVVLAAAAGVAQCRAEGSAFTRAFVEAAREPSRRNEQGAVTLESVFYGVRDKLLKEHQRPEWTDGLHELPLFAPAPKEELDAADAFTRGIKTEAPDGSRITVEKVEAVGYMGQFTLGAAQANGHVQVRMRLLHPAKRIHALVRDVTDGQVIWNLMPEENSPPPWMKGPVPFSIPLDRRFERNRRYRLEVEASDGPGDPNPGFQRIELPPF